MEHKGTVILETERLLLRRFAREDAGMVFSNWAGDEEVTRYMTWPTRKNIEEAEKSVCGWAERYTSDNFYHWAITLKEDGNLIGFISVISCDETVGKVEMGYCIGKNWWNKGYMTEALGKAVDFLFNEVGVQRIQACHDINNPNSGKVMAKCGMKYEGTMRKAEKTNNGICDLSYYAILAEDYIK